MCHDEGKGNKIKAQVGCKSSGGKKIESFKKGKGMMEIMEIEENGEKTGIQLVLLNVHDRNKLQVFITFLSGYRLCTTLARIKYLNSY